MKRIDRVRAAAMSAVLFCVASCAPGPAPVSLTDPFRLPPKPPRLAISNFSFDRARVIAVVTTYPDCNARGPGAVATDFALPLNGTRVIDVPWGADVCWHRDLIVDPSVSDAELIRLLWNRAYLARGGTVDTRL